jgi:uncharacterized Tic20 family protein
MPENAPEQTPAPAKSSKSEDNTLAILAHVLGIVIGFIGPLVIYLVKPEEGYVKKQAKEALNFQITVLIGYIIGSILTVILIGTLIIWAVWIVNLILCIMAAMAVSKGEDYKYPFAIRLIK